MGRPEELLRLGAKELGIDINDDQIKVFLEYMDMVIYWNKRLNLTAITNRNEMVIKHFLDSLVCFAAGCIKDGLRAMDVGTGAGFPGIPLKIICPGLNLVLLDSLNKRIEFLKRVIYELGLKGVKPMHGRAEDVARDGLHREKYDVCFSRAVAHLAVTAEYCLPFIKVGGTFIAMKGPRYISEIKEADKAIRILGGEVAGTRKYVLPFSDVTHYIITIKKLRPIGSQYPRKAGRPTKKPLI